MADLMIFKIDVVMVDAVSIPIEDGGATVTGAAGVENDTKVSASGDDYMLRKRIPRVMKAKIQFSSSVDPKDLAGKRGIQITLRDSYTKRKVIANNCAFKSMGEIGAGPVDFEFNLLSELQWM